MPLEGGSGWDDISNHNAAFYFSFIIVDSQRYRLIDMAAGITLWLL